VKHLISTTKHRLHCEEIVRKVKKPSQSLIDGAAQILKATARFGHFSRLAIVTFIVCGAAAATGATRAKAAKSSPQRAEPTQAVETTASTATLARPISHGDRESPMIALTFDDAPHPEYVPRLLALFRAENVKVTFFLVGEQLKLLPNVARAIQADGHEVGNHSMTHRILTRAAASVVRDEIVGMQELMQQQLGTTPTLYRPAGGAISNEVRRLCEREHLSIILWDVDTNDWRDGSTRDSIVRTVLDDATSGSIVLFHATHLRTVEAAAELIPILRARKLELVTVSQLLEERARREELRRLSPAKEASAANGRRVAPAESAASASDDLTTRAFQTPVLPTP
jgi:peptidoglycan/xylan/chitin deacetylase (PgdA/CDA1 family)